MLNQIVLVGRLTKDIEVKELEDGKKVSNVVLAISRSYKNSEGEYEADFVKCTLWGKIAENTAEYCHKGDIVGIKGRIQTRTIDTEKGKSVEQEVIAEKVTFLSSGKEKTKEDEMDM